MSSNDTVKVDLDADTIRRLFQRALEQDAIRVILPSGGGFAKVANAFTMNTSYEYHGPIVVLTPAPELEEKDQKKRVARKEESLLTDIHCSTCNRVKNVKFVDSDGKRITKDEGVLANYRFTKEAQKFIEKEMGWEVITGHIISCDDCQISNIPFSAYLYTSGFASSSWKQTKVHLFNPQDIQTDENGSKTFTPFCGRSNFKHTRLNLSTPSESDEDNGHGWCRACVKKARKLIDSPNLWSLYLPGIVTHAEQDIADYAVC